MYTYRRYIFKAYYYKYFNRVFFQQNFFLYQYFPIFFPLLLLLHKRMQEKGYKVAFNNSCSFFVGLLKKAQEKKTMYKLKLSLYLLIVFCVLWKMYLKLYKMYVSSFLHLGIRWVFFSYFRRVFNLK